MSKLDKWIEKNIIDWIKYMFEVWIAEKEIQ